MSETQCTCSWCQKGMNAEQATEKRISFLLKIFELAFIRTMIRDQPETDITGVLNQMKSDFVTFFSDKEQHVDDIYDPIFNIIFYYSKDDIGENFRPTDIKDFVDQIYECVYRGFEFLKADINITEAPVLTGIVTPEMVIAYHLNQTPLPHDVGLMYLSKSQDIMSQLLSGLEQRLGIEVELPERQKQTVH